MKKNDEICTMTKSEERAFEILRAQLGEARQERQAEQKKRREAEARSERFEKEVFELRLQLSSKIDEQTAMLSLLSQFMLGNGSVSLSDSIREQIVASIREEFEKREQAMKDHYEEREEKLLAEFSCKLAAKDNEIARLKDNKKGKSGKDTSIPSTPDKNELPIETRLEQSEQQKAKAQDAAYGQHTESNRFNHGCQQAQCADDLDLNAEDVPDEVINKVASEVKQSLSMKGIPTPRREQPLAEQAKGSDDEIVYTPDNLPSDAREISPDVTIRYSWVEGYIRVTRIVRRKYKDSKGNYYQVNLPKEHHNCLGRTQITESLLAEILIMHFVHNMTNRDIESWLRKRGLNFSHSTIIGWFRKSSDILVPTDAALRHEITSNGNEHSDETTLKCCDKRLPAKGEDEDDVEPEEHYFRRWLFCHYSPKLKLTQFVFYKRGRRTREAEQAYFKDVTDKLYVHSDGAQLYKCYDVGELIVRIACLVHIRRPFFKLKNFYDEAKKLVDLIDQIFHTDNLIKTKYQETEEIKKQRILQLAPLFNDMKSSLDTLAAELDPKKEPELLKAVRYALTEYPCMIRCLESGELDLSNNACERQIRRITKYRNNSFFVGSPESGEAFARLQSMFANIKSHGLDEMQYLCDVFRRIGHTAKEDLVNLLPHKWQPVPQFACI